MPEIKRSALVLHTPEQMYDLVSDVECYPEFLSWCRAAQVDHRDRHEQVATLTVRLGGISQAFTTRNRLEPGRALHMQLDRGPFRRLSGQWRFQPVGTGCRVSLDLSFEFGNALVAAAFASGFSRVADRLVSDFCERADAIHA